MELTWQTVLAILSTISTMIIAWLGWGRNHKRDAAADSAAIATMQASISQIGARVDDILRKLDIMQDNYNKVSVELASLDGKYEALLRQHNELVKRVENVESLVRN